MRTRVRAAKNEARLRSDIRGLQVEADRFRALLFAEPQILISWAAGDNRPEISGDISLVLPPDHKPPGHSAYLAFGTWLPPEPALQMDRAVDALRETGEGFLLNLTTSNGHAFEAMGRAIGGQAIVRIRELSGLRRELAETNSAAQGAAGRNRNAARFCRRRALADLGQKRRRRPFLRQRRLCAGDGGNQRRRRDQSRPPIARQRRPRRDGAAR